MKKNNILKGTFVLSFFWMVFLLNTAVLGQNEIIRETRDLPAFDQIDVGGAFEVSLTIGEPQKVEVEARQKTIGQIATEVKGTKLVISSNRIGSNTPLNIYITVPALSRLEAHGAANVNSENIIKADMLSIEVSGAGEINSDTTYIHVPGTGVVITESDDSVKVKVGNRVIIINEDGEVRTKRCKEPKFNGHWAGVDIGFNGYVNPDFNMNFPKEYEYMDLRMEKSIAVNLNFLEQNIPFSKNQKWGMVTGLGLSFNDYRFMRPTRLSMDSSQLIGYLDQNISIRKSKLSVMYLTLPVLFEFQTAPIYHKNGFHINVGMVIGARLSSHTKKYYNELNSEFHITQYNPETGVYDDVFIAFSPNDPKEHHYGDWFLQPFKFDATARIGWNFLNFWANYSLNTLFRKGKGPELYPWSAGITLVCF